MQVTKNEGARALYLGLMPALTRSLLYGGVRLGLYEPCKYVCDFTFGSTNVLVKIACGAFSGVIATAVTNPMEVLKVNKTQINLSSENKTKLNSLARTKQFSKLFEMELVHWCFQRCDCR